MQHQTQAGVSAGSLLARIEHLGGSLRGGLFPVVAETAGAAPRPARLVQQLGLDKSLASRLVRAMRCESDLEFVHRVPSPAGLRIFLVRAKRAGVSRSLLDAADSEVDRFQEFIHATPGGMDAINAHISECSLDVRETREHVARQAAYKAMSFLLGYSCDILATTLILRPSEGGGTVDGVEIHQRVGMHRLRPNTPIALLSVLTPPEDAPAEGSTWIESLDGRTGAVPPERFILPEFSTSQLPELEIVTEGSHTTFVLDDAGQSRERSLSITTAFRIRNGWSRHAVEGGDQVSRGYVLHTPCRMVIRDLWIAKELALNVIPELTFQLQNPAGNRRSRPEGLGARINTLDLFAPIEQLRPGPAGFAVSRFPQYQRAVASVFESLGEDPARFAGFRCALAYPPPLIEMLWWLELPGARQVS